MVLYIINKKGLSMWIGNRILLSSVTATLLLTSSPVNLVAAEIGPIYEDGTFDISVAAGDTITLDDNSVTLNAIEIDPWISTGVSILNEGIITVDSVNSSDVTGIISEFNAGSINNTGLIDVSTDTGYATGISAWSWNETGGIITNESTGTISATSIDGEADGIYIMENYGVVENYGNIDTISDNNNAVGIYTEWNETDIAVATITNKSTGTISATSINGGAYGIFAMENLSVIENYGSINTISENGSAVGISTDYNHVDAIIANIGSITAEGRSDTYGIYSNTNDGTITHSGTIEASTTDDGTAYGIYMSSNSGTVTVDGSIDAHSVNGSTVGIYIDSDNSGNINANDSIIATSTNGDAIGIYSGNNQSTGIITNNGTINIDSENGSAIGIDISGSNDGTITNNSIIYADSVYNDAYGIRASSSLSPHTIANGGEINIGTTDGNAYGIYIDNATDSVITNSGSIIVDSTNNNAYGIYSNDFSNAALTNSGTITAPIALSLTNSGTVENTSSGVINGDIQAGNANVQNDGTINLASTNTSNVNNFTQSAGGVLEIRLNSGADGIAQYSKLSANGVATLNSGTTLNVNVQTSTDYQNLLIGQQLTDVISATTLIADASTLNVTDTSALLNFTPVVDGATLDLDVVKGVSILDATQNSGVVGAYGAASVLEEYAGDDSDLTTFISSLNTLETEEEVAQAILETTPTTTTVLSNISTQFYNNIGSIVQSHQNNPTGMNSGDVVLGDKNLWIKPFGSYSKQNNKDGLNGFSAHSKGVGIGVDGEYENNQRVGLAVFYTQSDVDANSVSQNTKLDIFNLIVYGNLPIIDNSTNLFYQLGMGIQQTSSTRNITAPALTAKADYNAKTLFANIKLARDTSINNTLNLSNQLFGTYVYYKNPSYSESGAGGLNLNVQGFNTTSLVFGIEESLKYSITDGTDLLLNIALGYDFGDTNQNVLASYYGASGTSFTTSGIDNGPWAYKTGIEIAQELQNNLSVSAGYDLDGRGSDFKNHTVSAKVNWKF